MKIDEPFTIFCDNCGNDVVYDIAHFYGASPWDVASASKGESVGLCPDCNAGLKSGKSWRELA